MPIPDWNKQLYLDPCFLPSEADKKTRCYQREIRAEGRKIYACSEAASTLPDCFVLWRAVELNPEDSGFPGGCGSQISAALATHQAGSSQLPFVFPREWQRFPSAVYWNIWCFHSSSPSLGSACL